MAKKTSITQKLLLILLTTLLTTYLQAKPPEWYSKVKQIKVLQSSKQDVERIFDAAKIYSETELEGAWGRSVSYRYDDGIIWIYYSRGRCAGKNNSGWNVERDVIIDFTFRPEKSIKPSKLNINLQGFIEEQEHDTGNVSYRNAEFGEDYTIEYVLGKPFTEKYGKLTQITLFPTAKQDKEFFCLSSIK